MPATHAAKCFARLVLLAGLIACSLAAGAQDVPTVKIGQVTKKTVGTVTATSSGDVACYITLKDDRGAVFEEMAAFEICQQPRLRLSGLSSARGCGHGDRQGMQLWC